MSKNIRIRGTGFANNLKRLRIEHSLSKKELAISSGLTWRTVDNYEKDRFEFAQESALLKIAEALETPLEQLLVICEPHSTFYGHPAFLFLAIVALILVVALLVSQCSQENRIEIDGKTIRTLAGTVEFESPITTTTQTIWNGREVLIFVKIGNDEKYGTIVAIDTETNEILWDHRPDYEKLRTIYPESLLDQGDFYGHSLDMTDLDGDGVQELAASVRHNMSYPCYLAVIDSVGTVESIYYTAGHINTVTSFDMDYDGRDELYLAATNNTKEFEGGTLIVLDDTCRHGAALDSASAHHRFSNTSLPDSCRVRVVFPAFPLEFTNLLETPRMDAYDLLTHSNPEVSDRLTLNMGQPGKNLIVSFDEEIRPFSAYPTDLLAKLNSCWLDSTQVSLNYLGEDYLDQWLDNHHRFEAGHWSSQ